MENSDFDGLDDILLCKEILDSSALLSDSGFNSAAVNGFASNASEMAGNDNLSYGISVLDTLDLGTPPDFDLSVSIQLPFVPLPFIEFFNLLTCYMILTLDAEFEFLFSR